MKLFRTFLLLLTLSALILWAAVAPAADLVVTGDINGTQIYDSPEGIVFDVATIQPTADVTVDAAYEVTIKPGTSIKAGARFTVTMKDKDGLPNRCEMAYFGDLDEVPGEDSDEDQLTNLQECQLGTDPSVNDPDNDADGLPDWWEISHAGLDLSVVEGRNGDADGDGVSNWIEYKLGTDPTAVNEKGPGLHYDYDELGRIKSIQRIPSK